MCTSSLFFKRNDEKINHYIGLVYLWHVGCTDELWRQKRAEADACHGFGDGDTWRYADKSDRKSRRGKLSRQSGQG